MGVITMTPTVLLLITLCNVSTLAIDLFTFVSDPEVSTDKIAPCHSEDILSCTVVQINFSALDEQSLSLPGDCTVTFVDSPQEDSFYFESEDGTEATFTRGKSNNLIGNVLYSDGRDFTLEPCRAFKGCHVWMEEDETHWVDEESVPETDEERKNAKVNDRQATSALIQQGRDDSTTVVTYSVMFYYTPEFKAVTDDIPLFVSQVIAETNQGYINSGIPLRVRSLCIKAATLHDNPNHITMFNQFSQYKPIDELRNSADAATLLVKKFDSCGVAKPATFKTGKTVSVTMKSCAVGRFSFGHEIGHNFGCDHDAGNGPNPYYSYGLGKHICMKVDGYWCTGVRTIMAYYAHGYRTRVNYWSNPDVKYQGLASGTSGENNARVLREHRFAFAAIGDESNACGSTTPTPTPTTPTTGDIKITGYWGSWGGYSFCPPGSFVYGYRLRVKAPGGDDTALNDIELYCRRPNSAAITKKIKSSSAPWGTWSGAVYCPELDNPVVAMAGKMEGKQGKGDDTTLNSVLLYCKTGNTVILAHRGYWGNWQGRLSCPPGTAVNGVKTQVEQPCDCDNTAMNGIQLHCAAYPES